jgi:hypothetical protein
MGSGPKLTIMNNSMVSGILSEEEEDEEDGENTNKSNMRSPGFQTCIGEKTPSSSTFKSKSVLKNSSSNGRNLITGENTTKSVREVKWSNGT